MASPLRPYPPEHHGPSHAAHLARGDSLDRPVGRLPGSQQRWGTRRANPLVGGGWGGALATRGGGEKPPRGQGRGRRRRPPSTPPPLPPLRVRRPFRGDITTYLPLIDEFDRGPHLRGH